MTGRSVEASFADLDLARRAIVGLGRAGIEGQHVTLHGLAADNGAEDPATPADTASADARIVRQLSDSVAKWAVLGAGIGAALGIPIGFIALSSLDAETNASNLSMAMALSALTLGIVFAIFGSRYSAQDAPTSEFAFHDDAAGGAVVGVHASDTNELAKAKRVLERLGAFNVEVASSVAAEPIMPMAR